MTILLFLAIFSVMVLIHELGHFVSARLLGVEVEEFGLGFPPRIATLWRGSTLVSLNAIPLGGFVRLKGESADVAGAHSFSNQTKRTKAIIIASGVIMNVVLAYGLNVGLIATGNISLDSTVSVQSVLTNMPAENAGVQAGSRIMSINGNTIHTTDDVRNAFKNEGGKPVTVRVEHNNTERDIVITPQTITVEGESVTGIGVSLSTMPLPGNGTVGSVLSGGFIITGRQLQLVSSSLVQLAKQVIVKRTVPTELSGPVGIVKHVQEARSEGWAALLWLTSFLSINLAIMNVLPIPALDGGRLFFLLVEAIRRKPISIRFEAIAHQIGFVVLLGLITLITVHDISNLYQSFHFALNWGS